VITIDTREENYTKKSIELQGLIERRGVSTRLEKMEYGDYSFAGNGPNGVGMSLIGVERKKIRDIANCMRTGRLWGHQIPGLVSTYDYKYILVEGITKAAPDGGLLELRGGWKEVLLGAKTTQWEDLEHFITTIEMFSPVKVIRCGTPECSADWITALYRWFNGKSWEEHHSHQVIYSPPDPVVSIGEVTLVRRWAKELPGIGYKTSFKVEQEFRNGREMAEAEKERWMRIDGIGKKLAEKVVREIRGEKEEKE
jgi:ERCC4-type nuclease